MATALWSAWLGHPASARAVWCVKLSAMARRRGVEVFTGFCESHTSQVPFRAVARLLRAATGAQDLDRQAARDRVRAQVTDADPEDLVLLDDLLAIADPDTALPKIDPDARWRRLTALVPGGEVGGRIERPVGAAVPRPRQRSGCGGRTPGNVYVTPYIKGGQQGAEVGDRVERPDRAAVHRHHVGQRVGSGQRRQRLCHDGPNNRVVKLAAGSTDQTVLPLTGLEYPRGLAVDTADDVYVIDGKNSPLKFAAGSNDQTAVPSTVLYGPEDVALMAPATCTPSTTAVSARS